MEYNLTITVGRDTEPGKIAKMITDNIANDKVEQVELHSIGVAAVNQTVKAIALARRYIRNEGCDIDCVTELGETKIDGQEVSMVLNYITKREAPRKDTVTIEATEDTEPVDLAERIIASFTNSKAEQVEIYSMGADAVGRTVKAIEIATDYAKEKGIDLDCITELGSTEVGGQEIHMIQNPMALS